MIAIALSLLVCHGTHRANFTVTCTVLKRITYASGKTIAFDGTNAPEPVIKTVPGVVEINF